MANPSPDSAPIRQAQELLSQVKNHSLTLQDREQKAIDLAAQMLLEAERIQTRKEKLLQAQLARMMDDPKGKAFTTSMTDECFRSHRSARVANQMAYLLRKFGTPRYLSFFKRLQLSLFALFGRPLAFLFVPVAINALRRETSSVILPGEQQELSHHMQRRRAEGVRINLNHLGEAILGEEEAQHRLSVYLKDLEERDDVEYVSIKISTIYSQIHLLGWDKTLHELKSRLRLLYRAAMSHTFNRADGTSVPKFVNLDMEEYRDLQITKELFMQVLGEPEFFHFSAGIVLQAYLPDAHGIQKELTEWAMERIRRGGAPIKIRIVKGANLAMEQFEASLRGWHQAPYTKKSDVDANYKRMVIYGCQPAHAQAVHIGIASHNLFDIAYALLLRRENGVEKEITFEMLEGMADHLRRVVQYIAGGILLYCPVATRKDFQSAVAYLIRRLDENTGPDNFLRHTFGLRPFTSEWDIQAALFRKACEEVERVPHSPRRTQNRLQTSKAPSEDMPFENEADTDFALEANRKWGYHIVESWQKKQHGEIPLAIGGKELRETKHKGQGNDPSRSDHVLYTYSLADWEHIDHCLNVAKEAQKSWEKKTIKERSHLLAACAEKLREHRDDLIGVMIADGGKTIIEGDPEVSEAIDFAEYYRRSMQKLDTCKDILWRPKGVVLVTPPWNFPVSIPAGGIFAALMAGNSVIFKPAPEAVLTGWILADLLWAAGVPKEVLQFISCIDEPIGSKLISDPRVDSVILTGATSTAKLFKKLHPSLELHAETGGKNAMIITAMADRDLAIKDLLQSAFGHAGQKCSAASLAILEAEVYDDPHFFQQLKDAALSLTVGSAWDLSTKIPPLIRPSSGALLRAQTSLETGESWLIEPKQDPNNPQLWTPGIKLGVKEGSFMHQTELFGPVLGVMRADNLRHAIDLANGTPYGLTSGLHSLDDREQKIWSDHIVAGNCYINRTTTGAIVRRQPFGGCKASSFGAGAKAGGPNYVAQLCTPAPVGIPQEKDPVLPALQPLMPLADKLQLSPELFGLWQASIGSYSYWSKRFDHDHDPSKIIGQDNLFRYRATNDTVLRISQTDAPLDILRSIAAAIAACCHIEISYSKDQMPTPHNWLPLHSLHGLQWIEESETSFHGRVAKGSFKRVRLLSKPNEALIKAAAEHATTLLVNPVLANGRFEMLYYLREISLSIDYHRYGNLGLREKEKRAPLL